MINCIKDTSVYKNLKLNTKLMHAYLFYSVDSRLNNEIALTFAKQLMCSTGSSCGKCSGCHQFDAHAHPDFYILDQESIKVEDVNILLNKFSTLPITADKKVFVILNADRMNEIAQNKLLKSLEEPNSTSIFILTTSKTDKLLPTILSRLTKFYIPKLTHEDKTLIANELSANGIDITPYFNLEFLSDMINFATDSDYRATLDTLKKIFTDLNTTADIPKVAQIGSVNKSIFLPLMQELFLDCLKENEEKKFSIDITLPIAVKFSKEAILHCLPIIEEAYKMQMSNVNLNYILDNLLFNLLKERFLCK